MPSSRSPRHEVVHEAVLNRCRGLLGIFYLGRVVRQFGLRLLHAGLRQPFPEVDGAVGNEVELFFSAANALPPEIAIAMAVVPARKWDFTFVLLLFMPAQRLPP
jgi:hypothetical protein